MANKEKDKEEMLGGGGDIFMLSVVLTDNDSAQITLLSA